MPPDVIVVGDLMIDVSVEAGALARGGDVHGEVRLRAGGSGPNAAVWAASEGASVRLYGRVGDDIPGRLIIEALEGRGVEACLAVDPQGRTGTMLVVRDEGDRSMVADRGANARLSPADLPEDLEASAVLVSGYLLFSPGSRQAATGAIDRAKSGFVGVDAASWPLIQDFGAERFFEATSRATLLLANEPEAEALRPISHRYPMTCVKRGPGGAELITGEGRFRARPAPVSGGDPTGSGDAFDGVLLAALAAGVDPAAALERACRAGARCAESLELWPEP